MVLIRHILPSPPYCYYIIHYNHKFHLYFNPPHISQHTVVQVKMVRLIINEDGSGSIDGSSRSRGDKKRRFEGDESEDGEVSPHKYMITGSPIRSREEFEASEFTITDDGRSKRIKLERDEIGVDENEDIIEDEEDFLFVGATQPKYLNAIQQTPTMVASTSKIIISMYNDQFDNEDKKRKIQIQKMQAKLVETLRDLEESLRKLGDHRGGNSSGGGSGPGQTDDVDQLNDAILRHLMGNRYVHDDKFYNSSGFTRKTIGYQPFFDLNDIIKMLHYTEEWFIDKKFSTWYTRLLNNEIMLFFANTPNIQMANDYDFLRIVTDIIRANILFDPYILSRHMMNVSSNTSEFDDIRGKYAEGEDATRKTKIETQNQYVYMNAVNKYINSMSNVFRLQVVGDQSAMNTDLLYGKPIIQYDQILDRNNAIIFRIAQKLWLMVNQNIQIDTSMKNSHKIITSFLTKFESLPDVFPDLMSNSSGGAGGSDDPYIKINEDNTKSWEINEYAKNKITSDIILREYRDMASQLDKNNEFVALRNDRVEWTNFHEHLVSRQNSSSSTIYVRHKNQWVLWNSFYNMFFSLFVFSRNVNLYNDIASGGGLEGLFRCLQLLMCSKKEIEDLHDKLYMSTTNNNSLINTVYDAMCIYLANHRAINTNESFLIDTTLLYEPQYYEKMTNIMYFLMSKGKYSNHWTDRKQLVNVYQKIYFMPNIYLKEEFFSNYIDFIFNTSLYQDRMLEYQLSETNGYLQSRLEKSKEKERNTGRINPWVVVIKGKTDRVIQEENIRSAFNGIVRSLKSERFFISIAEKEISDVLKNYFPKLKASSVENTIIEVMTIHSTDGNSQKNLKDLSNKLNSLEKKINSIASKLKLTIEDFSKTETIERFKQLTASSFKQMVTNGMKEFQNPYPSKDIYDKKKKLSDKDWVTALERDIYQGSIPVAKSALLFVVIDVMRKFISQSFSIIESKYYNVSDDIMLRSVMMNAQNVISKDDQEARELIDDLLLSFTSIDIETYVMGDKFDYIAPLSDFRNKENKVTVIAPRLMMKESNINQGLMKMRRNPLHDTNYKHTQGYLPFVDNTYTYDVKGKPVSVVDK